jgi:hypothetical protein
MLRSWINFQVIVDRRGTTGQNDGNGFVLFQLGGVDLTRVEFAVNVEFADAAGNQVRVLRTEIQKGNLGTGHGKTQSIYRVYAL